MQMVLVTGITRPTQRAESTRLLPLQRQLKRERDGPDEPKAAYGRVSAPQNPSAAKRNNKQR